MSRFTGAERVVRNQDRPIAQLEGDLVLLDAQRGEYQVLRGTARRLWDLLEQPVTVDALCFALAAEHDTLLEDCREDVLPFLEELERLGLLRVESP